MTVALLFPGQGAQHPGMLTTAPSTPAALAAIAAARSARAELGITVDLDDPGRDTIATQLGLLTTGVACGRALIEDAGITASFAAGHSVGAFGAAVIAGYLTLDEALEAVYIRARSMQSVCSHRAWGMAAVTGLPTTSARDLADAASTLDDPAWLANVNSATQSVLAGTQHALDDAEQLARRAGARTFTRLDVDIASHGPLQDPTAAVVRTALASVPPRVSPIRYLTNRGGRATTDATAVLDDLASSVAHPVRWYDGVRLMAELGVTCAVEVTPGHTLTRLSAASAPNLSAIALGDRGWRATIAAASRHQDR